MTESIYKNLRKETDKKPLYPYPFNFCRPAKAAATTWSGDIGATGIFIKTKYQQG